MPASDLPDSDTLRRMLAEAHIGPYLDGQTEGMAALAEIAPALAEEVIRLRAEAADLRRRLSDRPYDADEALLEVPDVH
jgi:hypothetical protein